MGLLFAAKACFDVREAPALWGIMQLIAEVKTQLLKTASTQLLTKADEGLDVDEDLGFDFGSTHPADQKRQENLIRLAINKPKTKLHVPGRLEICQKNYTTGFLGQTFYTLNLNPGPRQANLTEQLTGALAVRLDCGCDRLDCNKDPNVKLQQFKDYLRVTKKYFSSDELMTQKHFFRKLVP